MSRPAHDRARGCSTDVHVIEDDTERLSTPEATERAGVRHLWPFVVGAGIVLAGFDLWSAGYKPAHKFINSAKPPIYGGYAPLFPSRAWIAIGVGVAAVAVLFILARRERITPVVALPVALVASYGFAAAVGFIRGGGAGPYASIVRVGDYHADTVLARTLGFRTFIKRFPALIPHLKSVHSVTHPPGPVVLLAFLERLYPHSVAARAFVLAGLSTLVLVPAWFIAERVAGRRAALVAVSLLGLSPAIAMFTFTSMDAVFAMVLAVPAALLLWALTKEGNAWLALAGGFVAGLAAFMTYAVVFVVIAAVITALVCLPAKRAIRMLALAAIGGVIGIIVLRVGLGFDLIKSYRVLRAHTGAEGRPYVYWIFGNAGAWLSFSGIAVVGLAIASFKRKPAVFVAALLGPLLLFNLLPVAISKIAPGETERTWLFTQPFLAAAAGLAFVRWERRTGARRPNAAFLLLLLLAIGQTIAMQTLFNTLW